MSVPVSILDLASVSRDQTVAESLAGSVALAQTAEKSGYNRVWYAEHHNMASIASSATSVLIAHVAANTSTIRLGSGGVMLPNHSPLTIAEQFGTLETLHPGRIDLGLGRAPGSDQNTMHALRRNATYILGSSLFGAGLAAALGLPFAFASHFAPNHLHDAIALYRRDFQPSEQLDKPHMMAAFNVLAADDQSDAERQQQAVARSRVALLLRPGTPYTDDQADEILASPQGQHLLEMMTYSAVGTPDIVLKLVNEFLDQTGADELIVTHQGGGVEQRLRSAELFADAYWA
jgi:alkanesulfonate monooxygenase SsuD/methylene tetrahydromethanopterin reductase-like flavin-dependent oxidoreductase (luciferase family)